MKPSRFALALTLLATLSFQSVQANEHIDASDVELREVDIVVLCNSHKSGRFLGARKYGEKLFGSLEAFYKNLHRVQCPPYYPSPFYHSVEQQVWGIHPDPNEDDLITDLENIGRFLTLQERRRLLNRPDKGSRKMTILDMANISLRRTQRDGIQSAAEAYLLLRKKLVELGAKSVDEMTPEELSQYK